MAGCFLPAYSCRSTLFTLLYTLHNTSTPNALTHPTTNFAALSCLQAIVFIRPTRENITLLKKELRKPRFQGYHVIFTNLLSPTYLQVRRKGRRR